jgi:hypothetical protein
MNVIRKLEHRDLKWKPLAWAEKTRDEGTAAE